MIASQASSAVGAVGRTLSPRERRRLRRLAQSARPCEITRVLYPWRGTLTDRLVRTVQRREDIRDMIWACVPARCSLPHFCTSFRFRESS